ncbi:MAG: hypothetical protein AAFZ65_02270 [Planctomycetota bacterium]
MDEHDLARWRAHYERIEAPAPAPPPAVDWARDAFEGLRAPSLERASSSPSLAWARETAERIAAPGHPATPGARWAIVTSLAGASLAAAAAALLIVLLRPFGAPDPQTTSVAALQRATDDVPRIEVPERGSDPTPVVRLRADGLEFRSGAVRLVVLDPIDED